MGRDGRFPEAAIFAKSPTTPTSYNWSQKEVSHDVDDRTTPKFSLRARRARAFG
jgi:hypothetical protein